MAGGVNIGSAYFEISANSGPLIQELAKAEAASRKSVQAIAQATGLSEQQVARYSRQLILETQQAARAAAENSKKVGDSITKGLAIGGAVAGFTIGLETVHAALVKVAEQTQKTADLQFQLGKVYGESAGQMTKFSNDLAAATGKSNLSVQEGVARFAVLERGYGLTREQTEKLAKATLDLAAVTGVDTVDAFERMIGVFRDGGESAEKLGLVLNDQSVKAFANLTAEQRKNFEQMDAITKSQIRYAEAVKQASFAQGAATEKANSGAGAWARLQAANDNLAASFGQEAAHGGGGGLIGSLAGAVEGFNSFIARAHEAEAAVASLYRAGRAGFTGGLIDILLHPQQVREEIERQRNAPGIAGPDPGMPGGTTGGLNEAQARAAITAARERQRNEAKNILAQREKDVKARADMEIRAIDVQRKAEEAAYANRRNELEQRKNAEIKAAEDSRDGQLRAIETEAKATARRYEDEIRDAEAARDAAKRAAEDKRDNALKALDVEQQAVHDANDAQIRDAEIARDHSRQAAEDRRDAALRQLDVEKRARDDARVQEDRGLEDQTQKAQRALDAQAKAAERRYQREADAAEKSHDRTIRKIDDQGKKEDERHRKALSNIESESQKALDAIDAQIKAIDDAQRARENGSRVSALQSNVATAQQALATAKGTGSAEEIAKAREELTRALRGGDETSVQNARQRLQQLAGQGAAAVQAAQEGLNKALKELQDEQTKETEDAEKQRLQAEKDRIKAEADGEKAQEDERNRRRKERLDKDKQSANDSYKVAKDAIDKRKADEEEAHDLAVQQSRDVAEKAKRDVEDRRRKEDEADQDKRREINDTYELEQRQIKATYDDEQTGAIPALRRAREAADREFGLRRDTINDTYQTEQRQIHDTYDDPNDGLLAHLRLQAQTAAEEYERRKEAVNEAYNAEKDRIKEVYDDPVNGLFQKLEDAKNKTIASLDAQKTRWETWKTDTVKEITDATNALDGFLTKVGALQQIGTVTVNGDPVQNNPGGRQGGPGGDLAYGPVVRNASPDSYWTSGGTHGGHPAADIFAPAGSPIYAPVGGSITTGSGELGGNYAIMTGDNGKAYYFAHGRVPFDAGRVERGQQIGEVGNTGNAAHTASHLHFAIGSRSSVFGELNGSGDIEGDSSYWGEGGSDSSRAGDEEIIINILGQRLRIRSSGVNIPGDAGRWIREGIALAGVPGSWAKPLAEIMAAESGQRNSDGTVVIGTGSETAGNPELVNGESATGAMQTLPSTFMRYAVKGHTYIYSGVDNVAAAARYIQDRYGSPWGTPYYQTGTFDWRGVDGYRDGTMISEPTLLAGLYSGRIGIAGETGQPEQLLGVDETRAGLRSGNRTINVYGHSTSDVVYAIKAAQHREDLLTGIH